jgi:hypothetical protein
MRPFETRSTFTASFASSPMGRICALATSVPSITRSVRAATAASVVNASSEGRSELAPGGKK